MNLVQDRSSTALPPQMHEPLLSRRAWLRRAFATAATAFLAMLGWQLKTTASAPAPTPYAPPQLSRILLPMRSSAQPRSIKDPGEKDPGEKDPGEKDPFEKDPCESKCEDKDPCDDKDPTEKTLDGKDPFQDKIPGCDKDPWEDKDPNEKTKEVEGMPPGSERRAAISFLDEWGPYG